MPLGWAMVAAGGLSLAGSYFGAKEQKKGIDKATELQRELGERQLKIYEQLIAEGRPEREAASQARMEALAQIQKDVMREPGSSKMYQTGLRRGTEDIARQYAALGLVSGGGGSTAFGRATGEFAEGLMGREIEGIRGERRYLAGLGPPTASPSTALGAFGQYGQTQTNIANLGLARSQVQAGFYKDIAGIVGQGLMAGAGGGTGGGWFGGGGGMPQKDPTPWAPMPPSYI